MEENTKGLILVYYINVTGIRSEDIPSYMGKVSERVSPKTESISEVIFLPVMGQTRVECINPKYITEEELIKEHNSKMYDLNHALSEELDYIKNGRSEKN